MMYFNPQSGFDPIRCYEDLRANILDDPFYVSRGKDVLQTRGMLCWLNSVNMLNTWIATDEIPAIDMDTSVSSHRVKPDDGFRNRLRILMADITVNLYREAIHV